MRKFFVFFVCIFVSATYTQVCGKIFTDRGIIPTKVGRISAKVAGGGEIAAAITGTGLYVWSNRKNPDNDSMAEPIEDVLSAKSDTGGDGNVRYDSDISDWNPMTETSSFTSGSVPEHWNPMTETSSFTSGSMAEPIEDVLSAKSDTGGDGNVRYDSDISDGTQIVARNFMDDSQDRGSSSSLTNNSPITSDGVTDPTVQTHTENLVTTEQSEADQEEAALKNETISEPNGENNSNSGAIVPKSSGRYQEPDVDSDQEIGDNNIYDDEP